MKRNAQRLDERTGWKPVPLDSGPEPEMGGTGFQPVRNKLLVTRRNLPHWQMGGSVYFITFRTKNLELPAPCRRLALDACRHFDGERFTLWAAIVIPDHVHLLLQPRERKPGEWWPLRSILHSIKSFASNRINEDLRRSGPVWLDERFDRIVRDDEEFFEKWNYIRFNAVRKGLCGSPEEWDAFFECTGWKPLPPD